MFSVVWAYYVDGFNPNTHCQRCFRGRLVQDFRTGTASTGQLVVFSEIERHNYIYICGVSAGPTKDRAANNFHLPLRYEEGAMGIRHVQRLRPDDSECRGASDFTITGWMERTQAQSNALQELPVRGQVLRLSAFNGRD